MGVSSFFRISHGCIPKYIENVSKAIIATMKKDYLHWHTEEEKKDMKVRCGVSNGFHHCVGIIDSTLLFLDKNQPRMVMLTIQEKGDMQ